MNQLILICYLLLLGFFGYSQTNPLPARKSVADFQKGVSFDREFIITDVNGRPFKNEYPDINGTPFLYQYWNYAQLLTKTNLVFDSVKVKMDVYKQEIHFIDPWNNEKVATAGYITDLFLLDSPSQKTFRFRCGYPDIDNQNQNNFYQILSDGRLPLLQSERKVIETNKNDLTGEVEKLFQTYDDLYTYDKGGMKRIKRDRKFIISLMDDQKTDVNAFLKSNNINFKNTADLVKLFEFYNSLYTNSTGN